VECDQKGNASNYIHWQTRLDPNAQMQYDYDADQFDFWDFLESSFRLYATD
jgi:hypothetical protein